MEAIIILNCIFVLISTTLIIDNVIGDSDSKTTIIISSLVVYAFVATNNWLVYAAPKLICNVIICLPTILLLVLLLRKNIIRESKQENFIDE